MKISKVVLIVCLLFVIFGHAQKKLTGRVLDFNNKPVANAKIYLDSIYSNVLSNDNGDFEVIIPNKVRTIKIYSEELGVLSSKFDNEDKMSFVFLESDKAKKDRKESEVSELEQKHEVITSKSLDVSKDKNRGIYNNIYDMIRGKLPGVTVSRDNKITIQGVTSLNYVSEPLFVVDGVIVSSIDYVFPNNVQLIKVLKGAEASIYGAQGSSGVIMITTKK